MRRKKKASIPATTPVEKDTGFNESHGYGVGHGGPTGPGDLPSPPDPGSAAPKEDDADDEP